MSREDDGTGTFELSTLVANAIERVGTDHEVVVEESLPESVLVAVDPVVFEAVLGDLVDALVQYGDESGVVSLSVVVDGSDLVVAASNDGDGIPPEEYEVVLEGEETPLEHASGLSLWLVKWGVRNLNGDVVFDAAGGVELVIPGCVAATDDGDAVRFTDDDLSVVTDGDVDVVHWTSADANVDVRMRTMDGDVSGVAEPGLLDHEVDDVVQFERVGYARIDDLDVDGSEAGEDVLTYFAHP